MKPIKILRLNRKHLSQMTYYFTSFKAIYSGNP